MRPTGSGQPHVGRGRATQERGVCFVLSWICSGVGQPFRAGGFHVVVLCHVKDTLSFQEGLGASEETDLGFEAYSGHVSGSADVGSAPPQRTAGACVRRDRADAVCIGMVLHSMVSMNGAWGSNWGVDLLRTYCTHQRLPPLHTGNIACPRGASKLSQVDSCSAQSPVVPPTPTHSMRSDATHPCC